MFNVAFEEKKAKYIFSKLSNAVQHIYS